MEVFLKFRHPHWSVILRNESAGCRLPTQIVGTDSAHSESILLQKYFNFTSEILQFTSEILKTALKLIQKAPNRFPQMVYILAVTDRVVSKYPDQLSCRQRSLLQKYFNFTSEILEFTSEIHKATANLLRRCSVSHRQQAESSLRLSDQLWFRHWTLLQCYFNFISFLC